MSKFLDIFALDEGENHYRFVWQPREIENIQAEFKSDIILELICFRHGLDVSCTGRVSASVMLECVRCLEKFEYNIDEPIDFVVRLTSGAPVQTSLWENDMLQLDPSSGRLDISPRIHDAIILAIPPYPLCSQDCKGLCPVCGANLNKTQCEHTIQNPIDTRWEKLGELLKKSKG